VKRIFITGASSGIGAALALQYAGPGVVLGLAARRKDLLDALGRLIPEGVWRHDRVDNNAAAHIKASILGPSETIPVSAGRLLLGTWQAVMLVELDGPRERRLVVTVR